MRASQVAALAYAGASIIVILFQLALAAGVPWGEYAMGGAFPGQLPPALRLAAVLQAALILAMIIVVFARAGVAFRRWKPAARRLIWVVVALAAVALVLNLLTPSPGERAVWAPVAFVLLGSSLAVAARPFRQR